MKKYTTSFVICLAAAACCAGCAKHGVVKQDQMIPAVASTPAAKPAAQPAIPAAKDAGKRDDTRLANSDIKESQGLAAKGGDAATQKDAAVQIMLEKVFFDFDSSTLSPAARATLDKNAEILKKQGAVKIRIEGNCDELGSDDYNLSLGESRAVSAKNYLKNLGIKPDRISVISYGKEKPAVAGHDEESRAKNRRDEFVILSK